MAAVNTADVSGSSAPTYQAFDATDANGNARICNDIEGQMLIPDFAGCVAARDALHPSENAGAGSWCASHRAPDACYRTSGFNFNNEGGPSGGTCFADNGINNGYLIGTWNGHSVELICQTATGPSTNPTPGPTTNPTPGPTTNPTPGPTTNPTPGPTSNPTPGPTASPTPAPTSQVDGLEGTLRELLFFTEQTRQMVLEKLTKNENKNDNKLKELSEELSEIKGLLNQRDAAGSCYGRRSQA